MTPVFSSIAFATGSSKVLLPEFLSKIEIVTPSVDTSPDADDALPYADAVFLDNVDAVKSLLKSVEFPGENYLYVGWDNRSISNVRKREAAFTENCPDGGVVRIPWRRDRKIEEESVKRVKKEIQKMPKGGLSCIKTEITSKGNRNEIEFIIEVKKI